MGDIPTKFEGATILLKANVYFNGKVVSHTITTLEGKRKTVGTIQQGMYKFDTGAPEKMEVIAGACRVRMDPSKNWWNYKAGDKFEAPGKSTFELAVDTGMMEYLCSYEDSKR